MKDNKRPYLFLFIIFLMSTFTIQFAAQEAHDQEEVQISTDLDVKPDFIGGFKAFGLFIRDNLKYPDLALETNTQGKVYVQILVLKDGSVGKVQVIKGIGAGCDEESVRIIKSVPKWKPGEKGGEPVNAWFTVPINFRLQ